MAAGMAAKSFFPVKGLTPIRRAGRTPSCLLKQLARQLHGLEWLERTAHWGRWLTQSRPRLSPAPLYGRLLEELAGPLNSTAEPQQKTFRVIRRSEIKTAAAEKSPRKRFNDFSAEKSRAPASFHQAAARAPARKKPTKSVPAGKISQLPDKASEQLIRRLGGETAAVAKRSKPFSKPSRLSTGPGNKQRRLEDVKPSVLGDKKQQNLLEGLSRRVRKYLSVDPTWLKTVGQTQLQTKGLPVLPQQTDFESQWNSLIEAPTVLFFSRPRGNRAAHHGKESLSAPVSEESRNDRFLTKDRSKPTAASKTSASRPTSQGSISTGQPVSQGSAQQFRTEPLLATHSEGPESRQQFRAEPLLATHFDGQRRRQQNSEQGRTEPSLRQLLQQAHSRSGERLLATEGEPNPFTVAKQTVPSDLVGPEPGSVLPQPGLRHLGGGDGADEYGGLAEKISSILADEARRHGIDV